MVHSVHLNAAGASFRSRNVQKNLSILERGPQFVGDMAVTVSVSPGRGRSGVGIRRILSPAAMLRW